MNFDSMIGRCTAEDMQVLLSLLIGNMSKEDFVAILEQELDKDIKVELAARWSE